MSQGRHGIKVLGLSLLAAFGLMAFAASAQAGEFKIEGNTFSSKGIASETVTGTVAKLKLLIPAEGLTIVCTGGVLGGTVLLGGTAHVSALASGCEIENKPICKPFETKAKMETNLTADKGFISASGLGELILMGGKHYLLVASTNLATIYWPKLCPKVLEVTISGSTVFSAPNALTMLEKQTVSTIPQAELESLFGAGGAAKNDTLFYGTQILWLDEGGSTDVTLAGANLKKTWGGE